MKRNFLRLISSKTFSEILSQIKPEKITTYTTTKRKFKKHKTIPPCVNILKVLSMSYQHAAI